MDDYFLVAALEKGGEVGRSLAFGVAKQHLEKGERELAAQWLGKAFYMLPKEDQVELLVAIVSLYPEMSLRNDPKKPCRLSWRGMIALLRAN